MKNEGNERDAGILSNPLSFLHSGLFLWDYAGQNNRGGLGYYWSLRSVNADYSYSLSFLNTRLNPQYGDACGYGFAVR